MKLASRKSKLVRRDRSAEQAAADVTFSSEDLLQTAIEGLLKRMPDHSGVQRLQGSQELGKDVIFYVTGGLGERVLCACVIKNKKISGKVNTSGGARTILFQAEQALDSRHVDSSGRENRVEVVYVLTPFSLPPPTIASIEGALKERASRVKFVGGSDLFDLFKKHWPEFIADEAALIDHIRETKTKVVGESLLRKLAFQYASGSVSPKLERVYITQDFYRELHELDLGPVFSSLPNRQVLKGKISESTIADIQSRLLNFDEGLKYLQEWGLCATSFKPGDYNKALHVFIGELRESWKTQLVAERKQDAKTRKISVDESTIAAVSLPDSKEFEDRLNHLILERRRLLSIANGRLQDLKAFLTSQITGLKSLASEKFLQACQLNDCSRSAPEGLFLTKLRALRIEYPKDILDRWGRSIFIVGAPGYGKTSFCRWRALQDAERFRTGKAQTVPVYVPLYRLSKVRLTSFEAAFLEGKAQSALTGALSDSKSKIRIYLDGLDEVGSPDQRRAIVDLARHEAASNSAVQIILTSRDYITGSWLDWLPRINIRPFSDRQITAFVDKWFGRGTELNKRFCEQLATLPAIRALVRTPLLATLTCIVFMQTKRLPESRTRLYDIFIELLSGGWDSVKEVQRQTKFGQTVKIGVLTSLAGALQASRQREFSDIELIGAIKAVLPHAPAIDCKALAEEIIVDGIVNSSGSVSQFSHLSFQEFLTARDLLGSLYPERASMALEQYLAGDNWWRDVMKFYVGLSSNPTYVCEWLSRNIMRLRNKKVDFSTANAHELLGCLVDSFPAFSIQEIARRVRGPLEYDLTLSFLRKVQSASKVKS